MMCLCLKNISAFDGAETKLSKQPFPDNNSGGDLDNLITPQGQKIVNAMLDDVSKTKYLLHLFILLRVKNIKIASYKVKG